MEHRVYHRSAVAFQVRVTVVANPELSASGETVDISKSGIAVYVPLQFTRGSLVQLDIADSVLYGFVAYSREWPQFSEPSFARNKYWIGGADENGASDAFPGRSFFRTGIEVVEVSLGTSGLSQLLRANFEETVSDLQMTPSGSAS